MARAREYAVRHVLRSERKAMTLVAIADELRRTFPDFTDGQLHDYLAAMIQSGEVTKFLDGSGQEAYSWAPNDRLLFFHKIMAINNRVAK